MSWFSKATSWVGNAVKSVGNAVKSVASVALPVAGFAVGLVAPSLGEGIGKLASKIGGKLSEVTGIGDGKPGILGIGDGEPGILGIGTGKNKAAKAEEIADLAMEKMKPLLAKLEQPGGTLSEPEKLKLAQLQAEADMKKDGVSPMALIGGGILFLLALL